MIYINISKNYQNLGEIEIFKVKNLLFKFFNLIVIQMIISPRENLIKMMTSKILRGQVQWKI